MKTIRNSVFETNSSSCHVVTVLTSYELKELKNFERILAIYKSQGMKTITESCDLSRFEYEIQQRQFVHDNKGDLKYVEIDNKTREALAKELWDLIVENMKGPVEKYKEKVEDIIKKYTKDEYFIRDIWWFVECFASKYELKWILERMKKYKMGSGETMNFSCVEMEC